MKSSEILEIFYIEHPEIMKQMKECEHGYGGIENNKPNPFHIEGSVWTHTMMVMMYAELKNYSDVIKLACLCHDLGKPSCAQDIPDKERRGFFNHESVSTFYTRDVLKSFNVSDADTEMIIRIVSLHGSLYPFFKDSRLPAEVHDKIAGRFDSETFHNMWLLYNCDHNGRFYNMGTDLHGSGDNVDSDFRDIYQKIKQREQAQEGVAIDFEKCINILIGLPRSGKSTFVDNYCNGDTIISRDNLVMKVGEERGHTSYSDCWSSLSKEDQKEIDHRLLNDFQAALRNQDFITVDLTNMSAKSRRKWLSDKKVKDYLKVAYVFIESKKTLMSRMTKDKNIPEGVIDSMMKTYGCPTYEEFDVINYVLPS